MPRQLKQFLRKRKAEMLACGDCECRTLKCRREATCECVNGDTNPEPTPEPTPTPEPWEEPSITFEGGTSEEIAMLEYGEDEKWSNSGVPIWFNISNMEESQLSFSVENCVTWISGEDVTIEYIATQEWDDHYGTYDYVLTISTAVDISMLTPHEEDDSYFHVIPYYVEEWEAPVALGDVTVCAIVV